MPHDPDDPRDPPTRESVFDARDRPRGDELIGPPDQPFRLARRLGIGGMGEVCLARDLEEKRLLGHPPPLQARRVGEELATKPTTRANATDGGPFHDGGLRRWGA